MNASRRLSELIASYSDVIPRRDYEQLKKHCEVRDFIGFIFYNLILRLKYEAKQYDILDLREQALGIPMTDC